MPVKKQKHEEIELFFNKSIVFIDNGAELYSSRCMSDPNFMALALTVSDKQG